MYCLRWWIPLFLLPFPTAPPSFLSLFIIAYVFHTRPCAYCGVIVIGLFVSSCYWYLDLVPADALRAATGTPHGQIPPAAVAEDGPVLGTTTNTGPMSGIGPGSGTLAEQLALGAAALWTNPGVQAVLPRRIASWLAPTRLRNGSRIIRSTDGEGTAAADEEASGAGGSSHHRAAAAGKAQGGGGGGTWLDILAPLRRGSRKATAAFEDGSDESCSLPDDAEVVAASSGTCTAPHEPGGRAQRASFPESGEADSSSSSSNGVDFTYSPWSAKPLARCPGSGRCWLDVALMSSHGLFESVPAYRLPEQGCRSSAAVPSPGPASGPGRPAPASSGGAAKATTKPSPQSTWPTLQELLEDARRQLDEGRAAQEALQRKIDEEQAEAEKAVVAAERDASSSSAATSPDNNAATAGAKKERQSRAARIQSRSRKPAFRRADPELDGEHTRGTYWIGVPGTAVGAFFDFALR